MMSGIDYNFNIKDMLVIFVIGVFQFQMTSITSKLNKIEDTLVRELVEMENIKVTQAGQKEDSSFLRTRLTRMDEKLSKHIEETAPNKS